MTVQLTCINDGVLDMENTVATPTSKSARK